LCAKNDIKGDPRNDTPDPSPVISQPLVEEKPRPKDRLERGIIEPINFVKEPRAVVKVLETRFVELFANERYLVAHLDRRKD
jgi:hypothetical protein